MDMLNNKILLPQSEIPTHWLNLKTLMPDAPPMIHPGTKEILDYDTMCQIFPEECVKQGGNTTDEFIPIEQEIREMYALCNRPTPLVRAFRLEKALGISPEDEIKIYYKDESVSPAGSHKGNTAIPQAFYAKKQGLTGLTTETGAGQWGSALAMATNFFDLKLKVFQVAITYKHTPTRTVMMNNWKADVVSSPSMDTDIGKNYLAQDPDHPGSLGIAISEAVATSMASNDVKYTLGSVVDFVLLHQTVIGQEALKQMEIAGDYPDVVIGCIGGGSNFYGLTSAFIKEKMEGRHPETQILGVEPEACPSMTHGEYRWDYGDSAKMAPIVKMYTLGHTFIPPPVHAGGLRYHGSAPIIGWMKQKGILDSEAFHQNDTFAAGVLFSQTEGIIPAVETTHAILGAINEAKKAKAAGEKKTILFNYSGHGLLSLNSYKAFNNEELTDYAYPKELIAKALEDLPEVNI